MKKLILASILFSSFSIPAFAQNGKSPFCDDVNAAKKTCQIQKYDCSFMMGDLDAKTLDTVDQIKSCPPYDAGQSAPADQSLAKLVCCLAPAR